MKKSLVIAIVVSFGLFACGGGSDAPAASSSSKAKPESMIKKKVDPMQDKGVGPVTDLKLDPEVNQEMATAGKVVYEKMCTACHKATERFIGPAPQGIFERRTPEWIMNMILNPDQMVKENAAAKKLLMEYNGSPMANQNLTEEEARQVLEYFRTL